MRSRQKYSHEQKRLAIDHYLTHGGCIAATVKELGYPAIRGEGPWPLGSVNCILKQASVWLAELAVCPDRRN
jgi:hypothetical protein